LAREPARIEWAEEAFASYRNLTTKDRAAILQRLEWLESFPEMYPIVESGRWAGLRRFFAGSQVVYYGYWRDERAIYIEVIAPAVRPSGT
jgi:hypothetical protein